MRLLKSKRGSAILTTIFLLFGILTVAMIGLEIIMSGLASRQAQGASAKAFWGAETGIERSAMAFKSFNVDDALFTNCVSAGANDEAGAYLKFCNSSDCADKIVNAECLAITNGENKTTYHLNDDPTMPSYWVKVKFDGRDVALTSQGNFLTTSRQLYVKFCLPLCLDKPAGAEDGCGGTCK